MKKIYLTILTSLVTCFAFLSCAQPTESEKKTFTVTFEKNDPGATGAMASQSILESTSTPLIPNGFVKPNYGFIGWKTSPDALDATFPNRGSFPMGNGNVTLYAKWAQGQQVIFEKNGGNGTMAGQWIAKGYSEKLSTNTFTMNGNTFLGWTTVLNSPTVSYTNEQEFFMPATDTPITLFAKWLKNDYTITYDANGGTGAPMSPHTVTFESSVTLTPVGFTRQNYIFKGWSLVKSGSTVDYSNGASLIMGSTNLVLYARWEGVPCSVVYHPNVSFPMQAMPTLVSNFGSSPVLANNTFVINGWTFVGWSKTPNGVKAYDNMDTFYMSTPGTTTLYALWILPTTYSIGGRGPAGGFIMHVNPNNNDTWKYMEAGPIDLNWGDYNFAVTQSANYTIGNLGKTYDDWYLPSITELTTMRNNLFVRIGAGNTITDFNNIGNFLYTGNGGMEHWSSTSTTTHASIYIFLGGIPSDALKLGSIYTSRPVRTFK